MDMTLTFAFYLAMKKEGLLGQDPSSENVDDVLIVSLLPLLPSKSL